MGGTRPSGRVSKIAVRVSRKPQSGIRMPRFSKPLILLALAAAIGAALGVAQPAQARSMSTCSKALIHDWYVDGRVDKTYPVHCYREALKKIPEDQVIYGTLRQDLTRALQSAIRQHGGHVSGDTLVTPLTVGGNGPDGGGNGPDGAGATGSGGVFHWLAQKLGPSTADSIPIPLLVLGGLAFALMAAAGVSLVARRMQARRASDPPPTAL
jgi:hypothetical protein